MIWKKMELPRWPKSSSQLAAVNGCIHLFYDFTHKIQSFSRSSLYEMMHQRTYICSGIKRYIGDDKFIEPNMRNDKIDEIKVEHVKMNYCSTQRMVSSHHVVLAPRFLTHKNSCEKVFFPLLLFHFDFIAVSKKERTNKDVLISKNIELRTSVFLTLIHFAENYTTNEPNFTFMMYVVLKKR